MGKSKKFQLISPAKVPLHQQIERERYAKTRSRSKKRVRKDDDDEYVDAQLSEKILQQARRQQAELEEEVGMNPRVNARHTPKLGDAGSESDAASEEEEDADDNYYENIEVNEEDEKALEIFMNKNPAPRRTLADIILEKITEKQTELHTQFSDAGTLQVEQLDPRVKQLYEGVRDVLVKYRTGKLPKAFKIVPALRNWEQILYVMEPPKWSAAAMYQATRIFTSNLKENMAQRFFNLVLLPRVRDDIAEYKRLNFHLYQAVHKALFKAGAFMKGFLLPLCEGSCLQSGTCSLREAIIIGSVLARSSIPVLHSSAAMLKIAEMDYNGANSIFLRIFLDKKYALPYRVVDAIVFHFLRFERDHRELPVLWHQALLTFAQRYKSDVSTEQREMLLQLLRRQSHPTITPEVRRELQHAKCRDVESDVPMPT